MQKELVFYRASVKNENYFTGRKSFYFQQDQFNYHRKPSQRSYLAQTLTKHKNTSNQRLDEKFIEKHNQKSKNKNKIGLPPNKRFS